MSNKHFPVRKQNFKFNSKITPKDWYGNNIVLTSMWNALSITFPEGESFFVRSVKYYQKQITDEYLKVSVKNFIGQEAMHGKEHRVFNKMLKEHGYDNVAQLEKEVKVILRLANKVLPRNIQLAATCALEHFTAILAEQLIENKEHQKQIHDSLKPLWLWHAVEESEHKHVAFDVYEQIEGSYAVRVGVMIATTALLAAAVSMFQWRLLKNKNEHYNEDAWKKAVDYLLFEPGLFVEIAPKYFEYFKPNFHPNNKDTAFLFEKRDKILSKLTS